MASTGHNNLNAKLVLLGDMGAGRSNFVLRFVKGQFLEFQELTVGVAFFSQTVTVNDATVKFKIWDTAGQEGYHSLAPMYYRVSRYQSEDSKRTIIRLEQCAHSSLQGAMVSLGAFPVLYGCHLKHYSRKTEVAGLGLFTRLHLARWIHQNGRKTTLTSA